jgi:hypothetical protein
MSDLYDQIVSQRGSFERLVARIPGFRGYVDKAARRTADRMLRDYVAEQLTQRIARFTQISRKLLDKGGLTGMGRTQDVQTKLQTYRDRVKAAAPGYSGFAESVKVGAEELERVYSFDEALIRYLDKFDEALNAYDQSIASDEGVDAALDSLSALATEATEAFSLREDVLTNISKSLSA